LFEADFGSGNIYEYTPSGVRTTFASGLTLVADLSFNSAGNLFETSHTSSGGNANIYEYSPSGAQSTFASGLYTPQGLAFNSAGNLFVGDGNSIYEYTPSGVQSTFVSGLYAVGLAFNSAGNLFVSDFTGGNIYEYTPSGMRSTFATGLVNPAAITFDNADDLYVAGSSGSGYYLDEITPSGVQSTFASGVNDPEGLAFQPVPEPSALALQSVGSAALLILHRRRTLFSNQSQIEAKSKHPVENN
jgi:glucose/arabinose dehydrogenase